VLIISRRPQEQVVIGEGDNKIVVTVTAIKGNNVKLGIEAPKSIPVHRAEVYRKIHLEKESA
jgi:carbon storage regulator